MKLKLSPNWKFWNLKHQLRLYLNQIAGNIPYLHFKHLSLLIIILFTAQMTLFVLLPLTYFQRLLLSDPCLFLHLDQKQNWIFLFFSLESIVFHLKMYQPANEALRLVKMILYEDDEMANEFFVQSGIRRKGRVWSSLEIVRAYIKKYLYAIWYFVTFEILLTTFYRFSSFYHIGLNASYLFTSLSGALSLLAILATESIVDAFVLTYGTVHIVFSIVYVAFTVICFTQLGQINAMLTGARLNSTELISFTRYHTQMIALVFQFNSFSGNILFAFMTAQVPVNTYLMLRVILGQFSMATNLVFLNFIGMQFLVMIFFHVLAAFYCNKVHACKRRLFRWSSETNKDLASLSKTARLRIDIYLSKFAIKKKKYGITYGTFGLMSFASFTKCTLMYSELILYWYRLVHN